MPGSISFTKAFVAVYLGFFLSFSLYELNEGISRKEILSESAAKDTRLPESIEQMASVGRVFAGEQCKGTWIDRSSLPQNRSEAIELLDRLSELGVNAIFPETFSRTAAVCYESSVAPLDESFHPDEDLLEILIEEAHLRGIEVHAWCWCLCSGTAYRPGPMVMRHPSWLGVNMDGNRFSRSGSFWLCPHGEGMHYLKKALLELARNYDLDGINLDYIRVEENDKAPFCMCSKCRASYFDYVDGNRTVIWPPSPRNPTYLRWRSGLLDGFVGSLSRELRQVNPNLAVSACVLPLARKARLLEGQNWQAWLTEGYLDFACALTYTSNPKRSKRWNEVIAAHRRQGYQLLPSLGLHLCKEKEANAAKMLANCLDSDLGGVMLFSLRDIPPLIEKTLQTKEFKASFGEMASIR